jgi:hypothetical protein
MDDNNTHPNEDLLNQVTAQVVAKILMRVAKDLTDEDVDHIEQLDKDDKNGKKVMRYLYEKVPNIETIIFEELQTVRKQASQ